MVLVMYRLAGTHVVPRLSPDCSTTGVTLCARRFPTTLGDDHYQVKGYSVNRTGRKISCAKPRDHGI